MAIYNVHGGHNPAGRVACGAVGLLDESKEDRLITFELINYLRKNGATARDCTCSNGTSQRDVLEKIVAKCNQVSAAYDFSIHLNSGRNDYNGDGVQGGFEIHVCSTNKGKKEIADRAIANMKALGFRIHGNGIVVRKDLYVLNHTKAPALLFEICFVDDKDDYDMYQSVGPKRIAKALAEAILNKTIEDDIVPNGFTGLANCIAGDGNWYYYTDGKIDTSVTTVAQNINGWFYVKNGKVDFTANTVAQNENGWWAIRNGAVDFNYTGLAQNENGWWVIRNGAVDFTYTGFVIYDGGVWYAQNGAVDFSYTGELTVSIYKNKLPTL